MKKSDFKLIPKKDRRRFFCETSECKNDATYKHRLAYADKFWEINEGIKKAFICKHCYNKLSKGESKHERIFNAVSVEY